MAPIETDTSNSNLRPIAIFTSYLAVVTGLTAFTSQSVLYHSYRSLPPSQATRLRASNRRRHVVTFLGLAVASLGTTWWHMYGFLSLSYKSWAHEMGQPLPERLWGDKGVVGDGNTGLALGRWLSDTGLFRETWEITIERSQRYWWSQQIILAAVAWALYVSIEGRKRNIRHLWAFVLLGQIVAVSFAMNLFFVAVLLTAVPLTPRSNETGISMPKSRHQRRKSSTVDARAVITLRDRARTKFATLWTKAKPYVPPLPTKPHNHKWEPYAISLFAPAFVAYVCAFLLPYSTGTTLFLPLLLISHIALFQPLYPQFILPEAFGSTSSKHFHYSLPRLIAAFSVILHLKQTIASLLDSDPGAYHHRHSKYLAYAHLPHESEHTRLYRSASAFGRVLSAFNDHPAVSSVGSDVLMCGISLGVWAAVRGIKSERILAVLGFASQNHLSSRKSSARKRRRRSLSKSRQASISALADDSTAANSPASAPEPSRRGKNTAIKTEPDPDPSVGDAIKTKSGDKEFKAPSSLEEEEADFLGEDDIPENAEATAVSWTLWAIGGLGVSAGGVLFSD